MVAKIKQAKELIEEARVKIGEFPSEYDYLNFDFDEILKKLDSLNKDIEEYISDESA